MASLHRSAIGVCAVAALAAALTLADPSPPQARANIACEVGISPGAAVTGAIGIGNPVGDACDALTDGALGVAGKALQPLKDAAASIGKGVFSQITSWATDGAVWLLGEVVALTEETTSPNLLSRGFLREYRQMASIAVVLATLMLLLAVLESLGRGDAGMLWRVFLVNVPLAAIATSAAYVLVQLLIATTDGLSGAVAHSASGDIRAFFKAAVEALAEAGGAAGALAGTAGGGPGLGTAAGAAAGATAVPLFVGFIAAILVAVAAFLVWIELLMRDAAIYVVALFLPLAIAASIWPRWASALRRTAELLIVVVFSKFVIVAIIALAASLLAHAEGKIEQVLAAGALLLLACFSPFVLMRLVPFAEGAVSSAYNRQSAGGAGVRAMRTASPVQTMRRTAQLNWAGGSNGGGSAGSRSGAEAASKSRRGGAGATGARTASGTEAAAASGGAVGAVALPVLAGGSAARKSKATAGRLALAGTARAASAADGAPGNSEPSSGRSDSASSTPRGSGARPGEPPSRPSAEQGAAGAQSEQRSARPKPEPTPAPGAAPPSAAAKPPRPAAEIGTADEAKP